MRKCKMRNIHQCLSVKKCLKQKTDKVRRSYCQLTPRKWFIMLRFWPSTQQSEQSAGVKIIIDCVGVSSMVTRLVMSVWFLFCDNCWKWSWPHTLGMKIFLFTNPSPAPLYSFLLNMKFEIPKGSHVISLSVEVKQLEFN